MKKIQSILFPKSFIYLLSLIPFIPVSAQVEFLNHRYSWAEAYSCFGSQWTESHRYTFDSLPVELNGTIYFELFESSTPSGDNFQNTGKFIRTDDSSRVFSYDGIAERLLYDFNLNVGDTFNTHNDYNCQIIVGEIDTIALKTGEQRRKWIFYEAGDDYHPEHSSGYSYWIEGIGHNYGLFGNDHMCQIDGCGTFLLCTHHLDTLIYQGAEWLDSCWLMISPTLDLYQSSIQLFPNPAGEILHISDSEDQIEKVTILNTQGNRFYTYDNNNIGINNLFSGYYIVRIVLKNGSIVFRQFVKL